MKILFIIPYAPSLIRVRPYNLIRAMADRGHSVTVATLWTETHELEALNSLRNDGIRIASKRMPKWRSLFNCLSALPSRTPLQSVYSWHAGFGREIYRLVSEASGDTYDVIHIEHLRGARYGLSLLERFEDGEGRPPIVWDSVDCISYLFEQTAARSSAVPSRWIARLEQRRTKRLEGKLQRRFDKTLVTSEADKSALVNLASDGCSKPEKVTVLTNGVDLDYFRPEPSVKPEPATVVLSGKMSYHANVAMVDYFMDEIFPRLAEKHPEVKMKIVGKGPPGRVQGLDQDPRVTVTGMVPDMRTYLRKATVAAVPLTYGAGIQNKVLEAMACGTPVVASPIAARSLQAKPGQAILVAESPAEYVESISKVISSPALRYEVGSAGRCYVEAHHDWRDIAARLEEIYLGINGY